MLVILMHDTLRHALIEAANFCELALDINFFVPDQILTRLILPIA